MLEVTLALFIVLIAGIRATYRDARRPIVDATEIRRAGRSRGWQIHSSRAGDSRLMAGLVALGLGRYAALASVALLAVKSDGDDFSASEYNELARIANAVYDVRRFGAVGDGVTDDSAAIAAAQAALPSTGGVLFFTAGSYLINTGLVFTTNVRTVLRGENATLKLAAGVVGITANMGGGGNNGFIIDGLQVDGQSNATTVGIKILDHFNAKLNNVRVVNCSTGILITDLATWSESTDFDNLYIKNCAIGIDFIKTTGTGSFGYLRWGMVHIDAIPNNGIGLRLGSGCNLNFSRISQLICHTVMNPTSVIGLDINGDSGVGTYIHGILEAFGTPTTTTAIDFTGGNPTSTLFQMFIDGTWTNQVVSAVDFYLDRSAISRYFSSSGQEAQRFFVEGEAHPRLLLRPGSISLGSGAAGVDTVLGRDAIDQFGTEDNLRLGANLAVGTTIDPNRRLSILPVASILGSGTPRVLGVNIGGGGIDFTGGTAQTGDTFLLSVSQPTINNATPGTIPTAASLRIVGAPIAGTGMTITQAYAILVQAGVVRFDGGINFFTDVLLSRGSGNRLDLAAGDSLRLVGGTAAERDAIAQVNGMFWYNTDTNKMQVREGGSWVNLV